MYEPSGKPDLDAFNDSLDEFMRAIRRARGRLMAEHGNGELSLSQYQLLDPVERADAPLPVGEVAVGAGISAPTATRMLDNLEREGLVVRERREGDRRLVHVRITAQGRKAVKAKREGMAVRREQVFSSLPRAERAQAARLLSRLAAAVDELR
jgi:MarR family transcriptional regulator, organic hydroperoxide resistance regulator